MALLAVKFFSKGSRKLSSSYSISEKAITVLEKDYTRDEKSNVTAAILEKVGRNLHNVPHHPINLIKQRIIHHFYTTYTNTVGNPIYTSIEDTPPVVTIEQNFDSLLVPKVHISRNSNDNYYINGETMLRAHTSAHQRDFVRMGFNQFLVTGDVYRRDEIDSTHYPVFHQMEGVRIYSKHELLKESELEIFEHNGEETVEKQREHTMDASKVLEVDLRSTLERLIKDIFGSETETRWNSCYFPFTHPSFELEVKFRDEWVEMLGSGIMRQGILDCAGAKNKVGWAFGLGLDRLAMLLFGIPDIRLLWSKDKRFIEQFQNLSLDSMLKENFTQQSFQFKPFSRFSPCYKDVSFWVEPGFSSNDLHEVVRSICSDLVEKVALIDTFTNNKTGQTSHCYRLTYRSMDRTFTNEEVNKIHFKLREEITQNLPVQMR